MQRDGPVSPSTARLMQRRPIIFTVWLLLLMMMLPLWGSRRSMCIRPCEARPVRRCARRHAAAVGAGGGTVGEGQAAAAAHHVQGAAHNALAQLLGGKMRRVLPAHARVPAARQPTQQVFSDKLNCRGDALAVEGCGGGDGTDRSGREQVDEACALLTEIRL